MDLIDRLRDLAGRAARISSSIQTEEACKNAFVMPFLSALGYDVFNPEEVVPEFTADVGIKKGEKVDYAIRKDDKIILLVECKWCGRDLKIEHAAQLFRYFAVTEARCAILTNGLIYQFFTDIDAPNKMDEHPFFVFNLLDFTESQVDELKKFSRLNFELPGILGTAADLKYTNQIKAVIAEQMAEPGEELVRLFTTRIYQGKLTQAVRDRFAGLVKNSLAEVIRERVSERLKSALNAEAGGRIETVLVSASSNASTITEAEPSNAPAIITTDEEREAFGVIKAIVRQKVAAKRVVMRDAKSYCAILLDDNNRKTIARLHFNGQSKKYVGLFKNKVEERVEIQTIDDIFELGTRIIETIVEIEGVS